MIALETSAAKKKEEKAPPRTKPSHSPQNTLHRYVSSTTVTERCEVRPGSDHTGEDKKRENEKKKKTKEKHPSRQWTRRLTSALKKESEHQWLSGRLAEAEKEIFRHQLSRRHVAGVARLPRRAGPLGVKVRACTFGVTRTTTVHQRDKARAAAARAILMLSRGESREERWGPLIDANFSTFSIIRFCAFSPAATYASFPRTA